MAVKVPWLHGTSRDTTPQTQGGCVCVWGCGHTDTDSFCRFEMDYEMRGCLGRGGFGVVYHVSNRTDGGEYAVKRIKLPTT